MIEIKLSQGAKPGHGGILPASKNTADIAKIRTVEVGTEVISPSTHREFNSPVGLLEFVKSLRELSEGKPVGFKLCIGRPVEFLGICQAMVEGLVVEDQWQRVQRFHAATMHAFIDLMSSVGLHSARDLTRAHIYRRCGQDSIKRYDEIFKPLSDGALLASDWPEPYQNLKNSVAIDRFC